MRMAMGNMEKMPKSRRIEDVVKLYTYLESGRKLISNTVLYYLDTQRNNMRRVVLLQQMTQQRLWQQQTILLI